MTISNSMKMEEKEKLLVTSNFCFSHNVFKSCNADTYKPGLVWDRINAHIRTFMSLHLIAIDNRFFKKKKLYLRFLEYLPLNASALYESKKAKFNVQGVKLAFISNFACPSTFKRAEPHSVDCSIQDLTAGGCWFDPWLSQYSFQGLMIVIVTGFLSHHCPFF